MGVVARRYIDFLILLNLFFFAAASLFCVHFLIHFFVLVPVLFCNYILCIK